MNSTNIPKDIISVKALTTSIGITSLLENFKTFSKRSTVLHSVTIYVLNDDKMYEQHDVKTDKGIITSNFLRGFQVDLEEIFQA